MPLVPPGAAYACSALILLWMTFPVSVMVVLLSWERLTFEPVFLNSWEKGFSLSGGLVPHIPKIRLFETWLSKEGISARSSSVLIRQLKNWEPTTLLRRNRINQQLSHPFRMVR